MERIRSSGGVGLQFNSFASLADLLQCNSSATHACGRGDLCLKAKKHGMGMVLYIWYGIVPLIVNGTYHNMYAIKHEFSLLTRAWTNVKNTRKRIGTMGAYYKAGAYVACSAARIKSARCCVGAYCTYQLLTHPLM